MDAHENVIVKASGLAVVEELSFRCAVHWLVSEERFPLAVHGHGLRDGGRSPCHPVSRSHCLILLPLEQFRDLPAREPVGQFSH